MNLAAFDLNLLRVFHALMIERHVTRAGERIGLSQPAVSAALNRLRATFEDELFLREAGVMAPTPRALALAEPISDALRRVELAIGSTSRFDAANAQREFVLMGVDYASYLLLPPLFARLRGEAPGVVIRFIEAKAAPLPQLLEEGKVDLAVEVMHELAEPARSQFLLDERYVVIARADHPDLAVSGSNGASNGSAPVFDLDLYCQLPHILHSLVGATVGNVDAALAAIGRRRHVALSLPHFFSIARTVAASDMIATFPERLARSLGSALGLRAYEAPVVLAPIALAMIWHRRNDGDAGHIWLRQQLMSIAKSLA